MADEQSEDINAVDIRRSAMNLLARREHSRRELQAKLLSRFPDAQLVERELERLAEENLQDDTRFAESFVRQRVMRGYGPLRLRQEMAHKGLADGEVTAALRELAVDWRDVAAGVYRKKFGTTAPVDLKERARRARFMSYRGFAQEHFDELLR